MGVGSSCMYLAVAKERILFCSGEDACVAGLGESWLVPELLMALQGWVFPITGAMLRCRCSLEEGARSRTPGRGVVFEYCTDARAECSSAGLLV